MPFFTSLSSKLGLPIPNPAPEIEPAMEEQEVSHAPAPVALPVQIAAEINNVDEPKKKRYAKEAWPGKKHGHGTMNLLV